MTQPTGGLSSIDLPDEEIIRYAVEKLHMLEAYARFVLAMERGLIPPTGDVFPAPWKSKKQKRYFF
jgi:hypothetical protein